MVLFVNADHKSNNSPKSRPVRLLGGFCLIRPGAYPTLHLTTATSTMAQGKHLCMTRHSVGCTWRTNSMEWGRTWRGNASRTNQPSGGFEPGAGAAHRALAAGQCCGGGGTTPMPRTGRRSAAQRPQPRAQPVDGTAPLLDAGSAPLKVPSVRNQELSEHF